LRTCVRDRCAVDCFVIPIRLPSLDDPAARVARRPDHHHEETIDMAQRIDAPLAMELPRVLSLEHRAVEHHRCTDEIDAVLGEITLAARFLPLEHDALTRPCSPVLFGGARLRWQAKLCLTANPIPPYSRRSHTRPGRGLIPRRRLERHAMSRKKKGEPVHGWLVLDKPEGVTSTQAVGICRRVFNAQKAGHGGTLDPLASGILPLAFGEATKTVGYVMEADKDYVFTIRWGLRRPTQDREGAVTGTSDVRPTRAAIEEALKGFIGEIEQTPPIYSAIKVNGERAYDLARDGEEVELQPRTVVVHKAELVDCPSKTWRLSRLRAEKAFISGLWYVTLRLP
jgi:tRNA pseudouridine(55) synthase